MKFSPTITIPDRNTGTVGERPEGLPTDLDAITKGTKDCIRNDVEDEMITGCVGFTCLFFTLVVRKYNQRFLAASVHR